MTQPYSNDLRERVVEAHLAGEPIRQVAARFGVSVSSVPKWVARFRRRGVWRRARSAVTAPGSWSRIGSWFTGLSVRRRICRSTGFGTCWPLRGSW